MTTQQIAIAIVVPLSMLFLKVWIDIKIKYAADEPSAKASVRQIVFILSGIIYWIGQAYLLWWCFSQFMADSPMTARRVFWMMVSAFGLFHTYLMIWIWMLARSMDTLRLSLKKTAEATITLVEHAQKTARPPASQK